MSARLVAALSLSLFTSPCAGPGSPGGCDPSGDPGGSEDDEGPTAPMAERRPYEVTSPNGSRDDPYYWLRDDERKDRDMLDYLKAENAYKDQILAPSAPLKNKLYDEMVARVVKNDESVPVLKHGYYYFSRVSEGQEYRVHLRKKTLDGPEQVVINENERAAGKDFYALGRKSISPSGKTLAFCEDDVGRRQYTLRFKDIESGAILPDEIPNVSSAIAWANDNRTVFYIQKDPTTLLGSIVKKHRLGTPVSSDELVYEEQDKSYFLSLSRTRDDKYVEIFMQSTDSTELRFIEADNPDQSPRVLAPRKPKAKYYGRHLEDRWVIRTNLDALNYRIMQVNDDSVGSWDKWTEIVAHDPEVAIESYSVFRGYLVTEELRKGLMQLHVRSWDKSSDYFVDSDENAYAMGLGVNPSPDASSLRYVYSSPTTPTTTYELDLSTQARSTLKTQAVGGDFDPKAYQTQRLWIKARDGAEIPVTVLHKKGLKLDGSAPLLQYGYGSYGSRVSPLFRSTVLSLVDRGFVYAIAHIRGGGTMGRQWYEDGKLLNKLNTFTDFIDVTTGLIDKGYSSRSNIVASGGSAGGLLVGAVANMRPDLYGAIVAKVPFVDVVTTMLDESIPLTTNEFSEWGNPKEKPFYDYMLSYSPYDNVRAQDYPAMLVTAGLWDSQVQYYEPAKWVARLRYLKTDQNPLLFHVNMEAGHGGKSGRFQALQEQAMTYAFVLSQTKGHK